MAHKTIKLDFSGIPQAGRDIIERRGIKNVVRVKHAIKKARVSPRLPEPRTTNLLATPQPITAETELLALQRQMEALGPTPILTGLGPAGGVRGLALAGSRLLLRAPGTRQIAEQIAGRATTLKPLLGRGPTGGQIAGFFGGTLTGAALIEGGAGLIERGLRPFAGAGDVTAPQVQVERGMAVHPLAGRGMAARGGGRLPGVGGMLPAGTTIVKVWTTGTANFAKLADGRIAAQRKDGSIKVYRPQKMIVLSRNPRVGTLLRADKRFSRLTGGLRKVVNRGVTRRRKKK